jgi:hypothetical protein
MDEAVSDALESKNDTQGALIQALKKRIEETRIGA